MGQGLFPVCRTTGTRVHVAWCPDVKQNRRGLARTRAPPAPQFPHVPFGYVPILNAIPYIPWESCDALMSTSRVLQLVDYEKLAAHKVCQSTAVCCGCREKKAGQLVNPLGTAQRP